MTREFPPAPGGIGTHAYKVALHLHRLGWKVTVAATQPRASAQEVQRFNASQPFNVIRMHTLPFAPLKVFYRVLIITICLLKIRTQVVIASHAQMVWILSFLNIFFRRTFVAIGHGSGYRLPARWQQVITEWAFSRATGVINVSKYTRSLMLSAGVSVKHHTVIPNGAEAEDFKHVSKTSVEQLRQKLGLENAKAILTVGSISERKGQDTVIRAMPRVLEHIPEAHYLIVGVPDRPQTKAEYCKLANDLGVSNFVTFVGRVDQADLPLYYHLCDLFVITSRPTSAGSVEGFGIVVVEAALCGKCAIVTEGSGLTEAIAAGQTGLSVPQDDPEATANAIISLLRNNTKRKQMGQAARRRAHASQSWTKRIVEYDNFISQLLSLSRTT